MSVKRGIDISAHQGNISLSALSDQIDFVIIRVGFGTKGTLDNKFKRNVELCENLGLPYGFYWYSYALDVNGASSEADYFLNAIKSYKPTYGCWFDMEDADGYKRKNGMPSNQTLQDMCYVFCEKVEEAGYYTGVYASSSWFNNQLAGDKLKRFDKWVAQWPTQNGKQKGLNVDPNSRSGWSLWQFTSDGVFAGYNGKLDTNYAYKDFPNPSQPTPTPEPTPTQKFNIGQTVKISGPLYTNASALTPVASISNKITKITRYATGTPHPYNTTGDLGWMNEFDIDAYDEPISNKITKGSKVRFTGTKSYSGIHLAVWTRNAVFDVVEISGDRVVIGKNGLVTSAVNIRDCQLV